MKLRVPASCEGMRLDKALARLLDGYSRAAVKTMIEEGRVAVGGSPRTRARSPVSEGEEIAIDATGHRSAAATHEPEDIGIEEIYSDPDIIVVNKRPGVVVHPARGNRSGTLLNGLLALHPELESVPRAGIAHRLDKDTSGLLVVARSARSMNFLAEQFRLRTVKKEYLAIVHGSPPGTGRIEMPIRRDRANRLRVAVAARGREALTTYRVLERFPGCSLLACNIRTGRTHQIRVHLEAVGHPVLGDKRYARRARSTPPLIGRQALHAWKISLPHPSCGETRDWECGMPPDMREAVEALRKNA